MSLLTESEVLESLSWTETPPTLHYGIALWIAYGVKPGDFLQAVFRNDLFDAFARGDDESLKSLKELVGWIYNNAPSGCHGSRDVFHVWTGQEKS